VYSDLLFVAADASRDMTASPFAAMGNAQPGQPQDFNKLFKAERDNLEFAEGLYSWVGENMDTKILQKYGKLPYDSK
jgi:hypothetical protein